ncbi:alpha/beta hydrolase [Rossellomorea aquimaris]|uniref:alpha/beta fold hydrolase n=1 Tax=Rossellomorea aquimaris TaxID=189382 RepID=UPI001CD4A84B|nr:alpha/beta hydrolase [Rossellomorea aquimaris]MCA1054333.1 alpha/beta hydrolase [Rossellomorea aquimaris]
MEKHLTLNGKSIYVKSFGTGDPIVFLHGGPGGSHEFFLPFAERLANHYTVILYDQSGCGRSEQVESGEYSIKDEVETLEALRRALCLDYFQLFGESWGSMLALSYAATYPNHVSRLLLTAAIGLTNEAYASFKTELLNKLGVFKKVSFYTNGLLHTLGINRTNQFQTLLDPYYVYSQGTLSKKKPIPFNDVVLNKISKDIEASYNLLPHVNTLSRIPIMIAQGSHDILSPHHMKNEFLNHLPHAEVVEVKESGHWTILEQPEAMARLTRAFFQKTAVHV